MFWAVRVKIAAMQADSTEVAVSGEPHPSLSELKHASHPAINRHLAQCSMCRSVVAADDDLGAPIPLDLPKGLVSENAFRWPADPIARGGMAQIFAGEDRRLARTVILKAPREGEDLPAGMAEMFQRRVTAEARILAKLQHPSIVTIYELGKSSTGWPFCVLERVDGVSLRDRLDELAERGGRRQAADARAARAAVEPGRRSPRRWRTRTSGASSTATARRTTSCSASAARRR